MAGLTFKERAKKAWDMIIGRGWTGVQEVIDIIEGNTSELFKKIRTVKQSLEKSPYLRRAYEIVQNSIISLPMQIVDSDGEVIEGGKASQLLQMEPNPRQTWGDFNAESIGWLIRKGELYWDLEDMNALTQRGEMYIVPSDRITTKLSDDYKNPIEGFHYKSVDYPPDRFACLAWDETLRDSPFNTALESAATAITIVRLIRNLTENSNRPSAWAIPKHTLTTSEIEQIKKSLKGRVEKAGKLSFMPTDVDIKTPFVSPHEAQLNETNEAVIKAIYVATGIPRVLLESGESTWENQIRAKQNVYEFTILPLAHKYEWFFTKHIIQPIDPNLRMQFDLSGVTALHLDMWEFGKGIPNFLQVFSKDEVREFAPGQHEPLEDGGQEVFGGSMSMPVGVAPPVKSGEKKKTRKPVKAWDNVRSKIPESKYKAAGGFTGLQRETWANARGQELQEYKGNFKDKLVKSYKSQARRIRELIESKDEDLAGLGQPDTWLDWTKEKVKFSKWAHPVLLGVLKDAGQKITGDYDVREDDKKWVDAKVEKFVNIVNDNRLKELQEAFNTLDDTNKAFADKLHLRQEGEEEPKERKEKLLKRIEMIYLTAELVYSSTAAETETHAAQGKGLLAGIEYTGQDLKQWLTMMDGHERDSHAMIDGEIKGTNEVFSNGLAFPGDPSGSADEVINCRCTIMPVRGIE